MLKGIDPLLSGELLKILDEMGHTDQLLVVDANYPAVSAGVPIVQVGDVGVVRAMQAILTVFPLDTFTERPLERMEVDGNRAATTAEQDAVLELARAVHPRPLEWGVIPRQEFYARARSAFAIVHTLERHPWACFVIQKGVIATA